MVLYKLNELAIIISTNVFTLKYVCTYIFLYVHLTDVHHLFVAMNFQDLDIYRYLSIMSDKNN